MSKSHVIQQEQKVAHRYPLCYFRYQQSNKNLLLLIKKEAAKSFLKIPKELFLVMVIPYVGSFMYLTALIWTSFLILDKFPHFGQVSSFWTSFLILDKFPHFGQVSSFWTSFLIMDKFPHHGQVSSFSSFYHGYIMDISFLILLWI